MYKYLIQIQYDGTNYNGFAKQAKNDLNVISIFNLVENAVYKILKTSNFKLFSASRTDKGVHALDQKVLLEINHFKIKNLDTFKNTLNKILPLNILIKNILIKPFDFKINSYKYKIYQYNIIAKNDFNIFDFKYAWIIKQKVNIEELKQIAKIYLGKHNFSNFTKIKDLNKINPIRVIKDIEIKEINNKIVIYIKAKGFIRYQIRYMIGTLIACLLKQISIIDFKKLLKSYDIINNKYIAPAKGLILYKIIY